MGVINGTHAANMGMAMSATAVTNPAAAVVPINNIGAMTNFLTGTSG